MSAPSPPSPGLLRARAALLVGAAVYMVGGPIVGHGLGLDHWAWMKWSMYSGAGRSVCVVTYRTDDGRPVDRLGALGYDWGFQAPRKQRVLEGSRRVVQQGRALCRALDRDPIYADGRCGVSARAQEASGSAWEAAYFATVNLCLGRD